MNFLIRNFNLLKTRKRAVSLLIIGFDTALLVIKNIGVIIRKFGIRKLLKMIDFIKRNGIDCTVIAITFKCSLCHFISNAYQPNWLIFINSSLLTILIFRPSIAIRFSLAKLDSVRIALLVVIFERLAKSSRLR